MSTDLYLRLIIGISNGIIILVAVVGGFIAYNKFKDDDWINLFINDTLLHVILGVASFKVIVCIVGFFLICYDSFSWKLSYLILLIAVVLLEISLIIVTCLNKRYFFEIVRKNWTNNNFADFVLSFEDYFKCCGLGTFQIGERCGYKYKVTIPQKCKKPIEDLINTNSTSTLIGISLLVVFEIIILFCSIILLHSNR